MTSIIQPRFGEDQYPIGRFVLERARALGLSRSGLVRRFGYADLGRGHRALAELLTTGTAPPLIAKHLAAALEVEQDFLDAVLRATAGQQHDEARAQVLEWRRTYRDAFRPHLQVQTERRVPSPIFAAAFPGIKRLRTVSLPEEAFSAGEDERDRLVKAAIVEHYRSQSGQVPTFGAITGYVLVLIAGYEGVDWGLPFGVDGDRTGPMRAVGRLPIATVSL
jgi:hypothetical protein